MSPTAQSHHETPDHDIVRLSELGEELGLEQLLMKFGGKVKRNLDGEFGDLIPDTDLEAALYEAAFQAWTRISTFDPGKGELGG